MIVELSDPAEQRREAALLARLARDHLVAEHADLHDSLEQLPSAAELTAAFAQSAHCFIVRSAAGSTRGYGLTRSWVEDDGTRLHLLDVWAVPGRDQQAVEACLFDRLEAAIRAQAPLSSTDVLGANCRSTEPDRLDLLTTRGFTPAFDMIEMEAPRQRRPPQPLPAGVSIRTVTRADVASIADLTSRVWAGRAYFTMPTLAEVHDWVTHADPDLYLLADADTHVVGLASATLRPYCAEVDDVQVDPGWRRKGLARAMLTELEARLTDRSPLPVRLHTEGHDPAGARSLYEGLGYTTISTHHRLRKSL